MISTLLLLVAAASAYPTPSSNSVFKPNVICGTAPGVTLSACQSALDNWTGQLSESDRCSDAAYKVASVPGCSIYASSASSDPILVKAAIESLMGCTDEQKTVSGIATLSDGTRVCVDDSDGCGDCFGHLNEEIPRSLEARAVTPAQVRDVTDKLIREIRLTQNSGSDIWYEDDRERFTGSLVSGLVKAFPELNAVICHTKHKANFEGTKNVDWFHRNIQLSKPLQWGTTGYELYLGKKGTFERYGDGGFANWAWNGKVAKKGMNGAYLEFTTRQ